MARKPAHLELVGGKGPRQRVWELIRAKRAGFQLLDVCPGNVPPETARTYIQSLERAGIIGPAGDREGAPHRAKGYILLDDRGIEAPRLHRDGTPVTHGLAQEQMWRTLRTLKGDTNARELAAHASTPAVPVSPVAAGDYLSNLNLAGYLECTRPTRTVAKNGGKAQARYRLISNTGPRPPMVQRTDCMYDPNLDQVVWIRPVNEETAIYATR